MGSLIHLCCMLFTLQVLRINWIQAANTLNPLHAAQKSTLPPDLEKIQEEDIHKMERIVFSKILPSTSSLYLEHNNSKSYKFYSTSFFPSTLLTTVEQTHYKTSSLVVEKSVGCNYYRRLSTSAPNNYRKMYQCNSKSNYFNFIMTNNNRNTHDNTFKTSTTNHIKMQITPSTCYDSTVPFIVVHQKENQNQHQSNNYFENIPKKVNHQINLLLSEKNNSQQYSYSLKNNEEYSYQNLIKPTSVILYEFPVVSINYTSSKNFGSLSLESSSLAFNLTLISAFEEYEPTSSLSPNKGKYLSTAIDEIEQKTFANYKYLINRDLKVFENETSKPKLNMNFYSDSTISSRSLKYSIKEVPVLKTKIVKSNSTVLTNIKGKEKRYCRLCKTATVPLKKQDDFKVKMTSEGQYFPEPKTNYSVKEGTSIETKIPESSNASFIIIPTIPPVRDVEPRTKMPAITQSTTLLPKLFSKNKFLYFPTPYYAENTVSVIISEISKTQTFQETETISSYELDDMEYRSNALNTISLYSSFKSSSEFPISHQETAYLNQY